MLLLIGARERSKETVNFTRITHTTQTHHSANYKQYQNASDLPISHPAASTTEEDKRVYMKWNRQRVYMKWNLCDNNNCTSVVLVLCADVADW